MSHSPNDKSPTEQLIDRIDNAPLPQYPCAPRGLVSKSTAAEGQWVGDAPLPAAPAPTGLKFDHHPSLSRAVAQAKAEMVSWSPEVRASVRLQGGDEAAPTYLMEAIETEAVRNMAELQAKFPNDPDAQIRACDAEIERQLVDLSAAFPVGALPAEQAGELPPLLELDSLADIAHAQATPEDWDADYRSTWQKLQLAERNKMQWRAYALQLRAALAARQAPTVLRRLSDGQVGGIARECSIECSPELLAFAGKVRSHTGGLRGQAPDSRDAALTEAQIRTIKFAADALEGLDHEDTAGDLRAIAQEKSK